MDIDKNTKILIIVVIIVFLVVSSATFLLVRNNTVSNNSKNLNGLTELYIYVPNGTADSNMAIMPDGSSFNFTPIGSKYNIELNNTLNISFAIGNREGHSMNYTFMVYQSNLNINNSTPNVTQIYLGATEMMNNNDTLTSWIKINPAYANNNSSIGIALLDQKPDGNTTLLNNSEIVANVYL